jgi:hypothetical protein
MALGEWLSVTNARELAEKQVLCAVGMLTSLFNGRSP